jgi:hypothetical protein
MMVTGGFRTRAGMVSALGDAPGEGACDMVGLGRPLCWTPDFPRQLLTGARDGIEDLDDRLRLRDRGWLSPQGSSVAARALNAFAAQSWYYCQLFALANGKPADVSRRVLSTLREYVGAELRAARATRRAYPRAPGS